jgi:ankyrin repeat protein
LKYLITQKGMDVNEKNDQGETALLCACRAGQAALVGLLLKKYKADASIAAKNGETPLHWLLSFSDKYIEFVAAGLIANGANINASTHERICHSTFPGTIDVDSQLPGTALSWAVHHNHLVVVKLSLQGW